MKREKIKVLMYHRVVKEKPKTRPKWLYVTEEEFRKQMKILDQLNFTPITFTDYQLFLEEKLTLPRKPIILTFDDGYLDTWELALPVLLEFGMRAVIFVMGNRKLESAGWDVADGGDRCPLMSDGQIREARMLGFEIGSHGMNHKALAELSQSEIHHEIYDSKHSLEALLGEEVRSFSYPYGSVDERVLSAAAGAGYSFGCGVFTGPPRFGESFLDFRRLGIDDRVGTLRFLIRITTPYEYAEWIYNQISAGRRGRLKFSQL